VCEGVEEVKESVMNMVVVDGKRERECVCGRERRKGRDAGEARKRDFIYF